MLRSMPLDPVDRMDLPGDFSPGLMSSQGTAPDGAPSADVLPYASSAKPADLAFSLGIPDPRGMQHRVASVVTPAICGGMHGDHQHANRSPRALQQSAPLQGPPTRRSLVFSEEPEEVEVSGVAAALVNASRARSSTPAHSQHGSTAVLQPPSTVMSCPQGVSKAEEKFLDCMPAPDALCNGDTPIFPHASAYSHRFLGRSKRADSPVASVRLPITPEDGHLAPHGCIERHTMSGMCVARMRARKPSVGVHALEHDPSPFHDMQRRSLNGVENSACDAQQRMGISHDSPQLGVQTLSPPVQRTSSRGCTGGYSVGGVGVSLSPPGSMGAADHSGECKGNLSPPARCDSESMFGAVEHRACARQLQADSCVNAECSVHLNINVNVKAVSNNSSTGKSSGVSSLDGVVPQQDSNAADASALKFCGGQGDGSQKSKGGDVSGDNGRQIEDDGSYSIRQKLHSLVDDVFAFAV
jgi:hypothetical protein